MKKIIIAVLCIVFALLLVGCNRQMIDLDYHFNNAYLVVGDEVKTIKVKSWADYENSDMVQITDENGVVYLTHSTNVILFSD